MTSRDSGSAVDKNFQSRGIFTDLVRFGLMMPDGTGTILMYLAHVPCLGFLPQQHAHPARTTILRGTILNRTKYC